MPEVIIKVVCARTPSRWNIYGLRVSDSQGLLPYCWALTNRPFSSMVHSYEWSNVQCKLANFPHPPSELELRVVCLVDNHPVVSWYQSDQYASHKNKRRAPIPFMLASILEANWNVSTFSWPPQCLQPASVVKKKDEAIWERESCFITSYTVTGEAHTYEEMKIAFIPRCAVMAPQGNYISSLHACR